MSVFAEVTDLLGHKVRVNMDEQGVIQLVIECDHDGRSIYADLDDEQAGAVLRGLLMAYMAPRIE